MMNRTTILWIYAIINFKAAMVWIFIFVEKFYRHGIPIGDYGSPLGLVILFFGIPLGGIIIRSLRRRSMESFSREMRTYLIGSKVFWALSWLKSCPPMLFFGYLFFAELIRWDEKTERLALPSGDTLLNETYVKKGWESTRYNEYSIEFHGAHDREFMGTIIDEPGFSGNNKNVRLIRNGKKVAVIIGRHVFKRLEHERKPQWNQWSASIHALEANFICSLALPDELSPRLMTREQAHDYYSGAEFTCKIDGLDFNENILAVTPSSFQATLPVKLVYSSQKYGFPWHFDFERTCQMNPSLTHISFPKNIAVELIIITVPKKLHEIPWATRNDFDAMLKLPEAKISEQLTIALDTTEQQVIETHTKLPRGREHKRRYEAKGAWGDRHPEMASIYWGRSARAAKWSEWRLMRINVMERIEESEYEEASVLSYLRIFRVKQP